MIDYDPHDWWKHFFDIKGSMVREILGRVLMLTFWSSAVVLFFEWTGKSAGIPPTVHGLVGVALGMLLVFRTNSSYDRFWEGRKLWGGIVNESRNLARVAVVHLDADRALRDEVVTWTAAWAYAAMFNLRGERGLGPVADRLPPEDVEAVVAASHVPLAVAARVTSRLVEARDRGLISDYILIDIDQNVQQLIDFLGGCERIRKTPLPFAYMVHVRRALILYGFALPFALVNDFGWETVLVTLIVSYIFFGIEEIGVEIEDPFGRDDNDLPLESICATIDANLSEAIGRCELPPVDPSGAMATARADQLG